MHRDFDPVTFQEERWSECWTEMQKLWDNYWHEVRNEQELDEPNPAHQVYEAYEKTGNLQLITVRNVAGELVGFHVTMISYHHQRRTVLCGFFDLWYLDPAYRKGLTGYSLLKHVEVGLRKRGVQCLYGGSSTRNDVGALFERLGWSQAETLYTKKLRNA